MDSAIDADNSRRDGQKRERSRSYPAVPLEKAFEFVKEIKDRMGYKAFSRTSLAAAFEVAPSSGAFSQKLAALNQFGLIGGRSDGIAITELARRWLTPRSSEDKQSAIEEAFGNSDLYKELLRDFGEEVLPRELANRLFHDYDITETAKDTVAKCFVESARFAGFFDEQGVLRMPIQTSSAVAVSGAPNEEMGEAQVIEERDREMLPGRREIPARGSQTIVLAVTRGRKVQLVLPDDLTASDIKILKAQLDVIALQIQLNEELSHHAE